VNLFLPRREYAAALTAVGLRDIVDCPLPTNHSIRGGRTAYQRRNRGWPDRRVELNLRVEVEEGVDAHAELRLDLLPAAFEHMQGDMGLVAVLQGYGGVAHSYDLIGR
jgi:hypothetical protein